MLFKSKKGGLPLSKIIRPQSHNQEPDYFINIIFFDDEKFPEFIL